MKQVQNTRQLRRQRKGDPRFAAKRAHRVTEKIERREAQIIILHPSLFDGGSEVAA